MSVVLLLQDVLWQAVVSFSIDPDMSSCVSNEINTLIDRVTLTVHTAQPQP